MIWLILTHLLILSCLSYNKERLKSNESLRLAWKWFTGVFFSQALLTIFRVGNYKSADLGLVEIWSNGFVWLFIGLSISQLPSLFSGDDEAISPEQE